MLVARVAWRNIWRHRSRTLLALLAVAFGTGTVVFTRALMANTRREMGRLVAETVTGHVQVQRRGYQKAPSLARSFRLDAALTSDLRALPHVKAVARRVEGEILLAAADKTSACVLQGLSLADDPVVPALRSVVREGRLPEVGARSEVALGQDLAKRLGVKTGGEVVLTAQGFDGSIGAAILTVSGIFRTGRGAADERWAVLPVENASELLALEGRATALVMGVDDVEWSTTAATSARALFGSRDLVALDWAHLSPITVDLIQFDAAQGIVFMLILLIVVGFGTLNTILMATLERIREFGVLRAIGMRPAQIAALVCTEGFLLATLGAVVGGVGGAALCAYFRTHGISIGSAQGWEAMGYLSEFRTLLTPFNLVSSAALIVAIGLLSSLYPAFLAARLQPVEAITQV